MSSVPERRIQIDLYYFLRGAISKGFKYEDIEFVDVKFEEPSIDGRPDLVVYAKEREKAPIPMLVIETKRKVPYVEPKFDPFSKDVITQAERYATWLGCNTQEILPILEKRAPLDIQPTQIYQKLLKHFGEQHWWPAETRFEIVIGAILTQQTTWKNVERAIENLRGEGLLDPHSLAVSSLNQVEALIRHTGFYRQKAKRIINFSQHLISKYDGSLDRFFDRSTEKIREELLSLEGVGSETADSIVLYAADRLTFPIDAYAIRLCERLGVKETRYEELKALFEATLPKDLEVYKEFHALIDKLGKTYCKAKPRCSECPIANDCSFYLNRGQ